MNTYDVLIRNGRVIDPANGIDDNLDVAIKGGRIAAVGDGLEGDATEVFDAAGKIVTPGLVDIHIHGYDKVVPLAVDVDHYCLGRGVTTAVDAGSAGSDTFPGFRAFSVDRFKTRLLGFLNISRLGLACSGLGGDNEIPGELDMLKFVNTKTCIDVIEANRDILVGVKIRLSDSCANDGANEPESFERAVAAAREVDLPLMTHHSFSTVPLEDCPGRMRNSDIYTHCYHGFPSTIINPDSRAIEESVRRARDNGVRFDIGFGQGSFNWTVAEIAADAGFLPDTISTDLHAGTCEGPAYDMPSVMTRLLRVGMGLPEIIQRSTIEPARAINWEDRIGTLGVGREADVTVLNVDQVDLELEDCQGQMRRITERIVASAVWRAGVRGVITEPKRFPNPDILETQRGWWPRLLVRDASL